MSAEAVNRHADSVDQAADKVETGRAAAAHVQLGRGAYGQLCQFLPTLLEPVTDAVVDALTDSVSALQNTATKLRGVAGRTVAADQRGADRVTGSGRKLNLPL